MKNRKPKSEPFHFRIKTEPKRKITENRKPNGLDIQKPNGSVFGSVLANNRTEPNRTVLTPNPAHIRYEYQHIAHTIVI